MCQVVWAHHFRGHFWNHITAKNETKHYRHHQQSHHNNIALEHIWCSGKRLWHCIDKSNLTLTWRLCAIVTDIHSNYFNSPQIKCRNLLRNWSNAGIEVQCLYCRKQLIWQSCLSRDGSWWSKCLDVFIFISFFLFMFLLLLFKIMFNFKCKNMSYAIRNIYL